MNEPSSGGPPPLPRKNQTSQPQSAEESFPALARSQETETSGFAEQSITNRGEVPRPDSSPLPLQIEPLPVIRAGDVPRKNYSSVPLIMCAALTILFTLIGCIFFVVILWPRPEPMPIPAAVGNTPMMPVQINPPGGGGAPNGFPNVTIPKGPNPFPDFPNNKDLTVPKTPFK